MNGVQTRFKCKLDVKRCKRFVFPPSSLLPRSNALKTKAIRYFQTDRTLTRIVSPPLYLAILKKVCRIAYKEGYVERCFFANFTLPQKTERTPRALSREDFEKIRDVEIPAWRTTHILVRDLFLFACYTGTAYADAVSVTRDNLYTDDEGCLWLKYRRQKNELRASVKLLPEALALIEKYHDENRPTLFPMVYHPNLRRHMKSLAVLAGVSSTLCYHQARHSFASLITLEAGVPIETISRMLGHSDITTTQVYARVTPKKLFEDMDRYIEATKDLKLVL